MAKAIFASYAPGYSIDGTMTEEGLHAALQDALTRAK
jgi:hypothetical protein